MTYMEKSRQAWAWAIGNVAAVTLGMAGFAAAGLFLTALGGGFAGWAWISGAIALLLFVLGGLVYRAGKKRRKDQQRTVTYAPDNLDTPVDIDTRTGVWSRHQPATDGGERARENESQ